MNNLKTYGVGALVALLVSLALYLVLPDKVQTIIRETVGAIPGDTVSGDEFEVGALRTFSKKVNWTTGSTRGVICQISLPSASTTLTHLGVFGASPLNSAGNLKVYVASTTSKIGVADGGLATSTNREILSVVIADGVAINLIATSSIFDYSGVKVTGYVNPFLPPNGVIIFDYSAATSSVGNQHRFSTCEVQSVYQR